MASLLAKFRPSVPRLALCRFASSLMTTFRKPGEVVQAETHTGIKWDENDYRLARFTEAAREVNPNFAIDLVNKIPPKKVKARVFWCDGGDERLGHPKVYINLDAPEPQTCGYCGLRYERDHDHH